MKSRRSGTLKSGKFGLSCSDAGTGDLGVLPTQEPSVMEMTVYVAPGKPWFSATSVGKLNQYFRERTISM